ncbi:xanthine dehydrogenase family protein molybdopterin-binding subunit [Algoriphagus aestuariicola]|uniref:Xanthine dehydrogenase family protein molybdopterin-binding subunit n=1 Tax=Algoriphagus aestuariicola TaxID=1852016 RepID=A0ABS3BX09_9BACT|nr:molybdopterin cofactor-binding domain-containing protein [Algoriphagus aestuariicola]MBN7803632.1 xanthine dehydrogenase family protein molybdopterin-binding subunit [Algoriphagus aestuariicola]
MLPTSQKNGILNRREFLKSSSGIALFIGASGIFPALVSCSDSKTIQQQFEKHAITAWVKISEDGQIIIYNPASEMGQGSMTSLPLIFAEEMDADWSKVKVEFSPQESETYGSPGWSPGSKMMFTVGSRTTNSYFNTMRTAGAQAKAILLHAAAQHWKVPIKELSVENSVVSHTESAKTISYGELIPYLVAGETLPDLSEVPLKALDKFKLIGHEIPRTEIPSKVDGTAQFAIDVRLPDMVYGVLERGNLHGAKPTLLNESEILGMEGVIKLVPFDYAIGVIASKLEQALKAKSQLKIDWSSSDASGFNSEEIYQEYEKIANQNQSGEVITNEGDVSKALRNASKVYQADYKNDYVYHAQLEPLNAVIQVSEDLQKAEVWVGSQQGMDTKLGVPGILGIPPENVNVHLQYLGGGFGRRSLSDFVEECAVLAKEVAPKPVKLIWTREDDLRYGTYRPMSLQRIKASVDASGNINAFSHTVVGDGGNLVASGIQNDHYAIPNQFADWRSTTHGIRLKHWRSVGHGPNKFAIESILDQIAYDQKMDPVDLRRKLMANSPRALATLEKAVEISNWAEPSPEGFAKGISFVEHGSLGTGVCEISLNKETGEIKVHRVWIALDAGTIIQPDNVKAQMEGGIIMGISSALKERISVVDGHIQQNNFNDYSLLRMQDSPDIIETVLIPSGETPQGVGETATPMVAGAIANAFLQLTGKYLRHMPFTPDRVLEALNS